MKDDKELEPELIALYHQTMAMEAQLVVIQNLSEELKVISEQMKRVGGGFMSAQFTETKLKLAHAKTQLKILGKAKL